MRKIIIDTDTATDDAIAIIMALKCRDLDVVAVTTVAGNVDINLATTNALYTCELCGYEVPVYFDFHKQNFSSICNNFITI